MMFFKKIQNYFYYIKQIKKNWADLSGPEFVMIKDWFYRIGTVINIPTEIVPEYGDSLLRENVKNYIDKVKNKMYQIGLMELIYVKTVEKIDDYNIKVVFGFKLIKASDIIVALQNFITVGVLSAILYFLINIVFF